MHRSLYLRNYSFLSTLSLLWWEYLTTCDNEYELIWRRPINNIKCIFLFSRYVPLILLTINAALLFGPLSQPHIDASICRAWFVFWFGLSVVLYFALELFLTARVYALYGRNTKVVFYLGTLMIVEMTLMIYSIVMTFKHGVFRSDSCDVKEIPHGIFYYSACILLSQFSLFYMTYVKRNVFLGVVPVVRIMIRDGISSFIAICALVCAAIPYSTVSEYLSAHILFNWPLVLTSVITCRMIVNLQRLNVGRAASATDSREQSQILTTYIESRSGTA